MLKFISQPTHGGNVMRFMFDPTKRVQTTLVYRHHEQVELHIVYCSTVVWIRSTIILSVVWFLFAPLAVNTRKTLMTMRTK